MAKEFKDMFDEKGQPVERQAGSLQHPASKRVAQDTGLPRAVRVLKF